MFSGRLTRMPYFLRMLTIAVFCAAAKMAAYDDYGYATEFIELYIVIVIAATVVGASFVVKRLHDLGRPGHHYWLLFIPLYNIYFALRLLFEKGQLAKSRQPSQVVEHTGSPFVRNKRDVSWIIPVVIVGLFVVCLIKIAVRQ